MIARARVLAASAVLSLLAGAAHAQGLGGTTLGDEDGKNLPVNIAADNGIEWRQADHVYIAHGNVKAVRGRITIYADELRAYYRPVAPSDAAAKPETKPAKPKPPATPAAAPGTKGATPSFEEGPTEIYRVEAVGNVRFVTDTQTAYGERAVYDVDETLLVMTGKNLRIIAPHDTITARDSIEWYDNRQFGVARGDAVDLHDGKRIAADVLTATMEHPEGEQASIRRVDAQGNVFVSSQDQIGRGDSGVYNSDTGIVTLTGHVRLTRNQNEMRGQYGVVDLNRNVGHLLPAPPSQGTASGPHARVQALIMPGAKTGAAGGGETNPPRHRRQQGDPANETTKPGT
jgi:lipopolysaccharide export system protein LptA